MSYHTTQYVPAFAYTNGSSVTGQAGYASPNTSAGYYPPTATPTRPAYDTQYSTSSQVYEGKYAQPVSHDPSHDPMSQGQGQITRKTGIIGRWHDLSRKTKIIVLVILAVVVIGAAVGGGIAGSGLSGGSSSSGGSTSGGSSKQPGTVSEVFRYCSERSACSSDSSPMSTLIVSSVHGSGQHVKTLTWPVGMRTDWFSLWQWML